MYIIIPPLSHSPTPPLPHSPTPPLPHSPTLPTLPLPHSPTPPLPTPYIFLVESVPKPGRFSECQSTRF
ncbi:hypothetical protein [Argonema antarcticum]|uniref:hypothetical protein n=1 Tax=Argonema antarcticum TaxID=2942763 RepID=UPI0020135200|nr:hypothetical protein [Argonema antarcticum]MCL1471756.1 hypothetical protein [Argonema antarcticum A004/B2]